MTWEERGKLTARTIRLILVLTFGLLGLARVFGQAQSEVRLVLDQGTVKPRGVARIAVEMKVFPGWHVYWRNPSALGGVGSPPKVDWTLPPGIKAGPIQWPVPQHLEDPAGDSPGYTGTVWLLVPLEIGESVPPGEVTLRAKVSWQECEHECVLGRTNLEARIKIGPKSVPSFESGRFVAAEALLPRLGTNLEMSARWDGPPVRAEGRLLVIEWAAEAASGTFFPFENKSLPLDGKPQPSSKLNGHLQVRHLVDASEGAWPSTASGLVVVDAPGLGRVGYEVSLAIAEATRNSSSGIAPSSMSSLATVIPMLGLAFLGGLILNIMPCVLPVLALKILGFVRQAGSEPRKVRRLGLYYGAGVVTSFLILAVVALAVQAAGSIAGWSTAFQNPQFRVILCVLLVLVALNLFGVFEVNLSGAALDETTRFTRRALMGPLAMLRGESATAVWVQGTEGAEILQQEGPLGAFFNGVLAAVLATPCTAPMLSAAITFAFTQPPAILVLIFLTVGLGLASPFVVLCWRPQWLKWMPKPGSWMVRFKVAMGFPILGTGVWIFWFTAGRMGDAGVLWLGLFLVVISAAAWVWGEFYQRGGGSVRAVWVAALLVAGAYFGILEGQLQWRSSVGHRAPKLSWQTWSPAAVEAARRAGHPVLVDFTADNCLNCQLNKRTSIEIESTRERLKKYGVLLFEGDYTDANPAIAEELRRHGRRGVPLVLVYSRTLAQEPRELPTILTPSLVHEALDWAAGAVVAKP